MKTQTETITKHTPGPWKCHLGRGASPRFHVQTEGGYQIASTTETVRHSQAVEENAMRGANAALIAAAPELLAACEYSLLALREFEVMPELQKRLELIIAKATGQ